jgi:hypothetical protein
MGSTWRSDVCTLPNDRRNARRGCGTNGGLFIRLGVADGPRFHPSPLRDDDCGGFSRFGRRPQDDRGVPGRSVRESIHEPRNFQHLVVAIALGLSACGEEKPLPPKVEEVEKEWKSTVDGERAMQTVIRLCKEPRVPGTPGYVRAQQLLKADLAAGVARVDDQPVRGENPDRHDQVQQSSACCPARRRTASPSAPTTIRSDCPGLPLRRGGRTLALGLRSCFLERHAKLATKTDRNETI